MVTKIAVLALVTLSTYAGVGGIAGGTEKFQKGSHINFQRASTFVNVLYSRTLCHDNHDFQAVVRQCVLWSNDDDRKCLEHEKVKIYQPMESTRQRCKRKEDDKCVEWITVPFIQGPKRIVEIKDDEDNVKSIKRVIVPSCK